ncbi:Na/Pi cotransporter family protein [soil metagenome]
MGGVDIAGGIGLTLFGVRFLRKGLDRLFGGKLIGWLNRMTANPWRAFTGGLVAGTIVPSSSGLSLYAAQMLTNGQLTSERMLAVLLGANVGWSVTIQLLAFRVQDYAGLVILLGIIGFQFLSRESFRGIGQCLLSLGFVFLAIQMIGRGASDFAGSPDAVEIFKLLASHQWLVLIAVSGLAVLLQSSTATIGLGLGLASAGLFTPLILIPWVIGTNLGLALTSLIAGWSQIDGRRMGLSNLMVKLVIALPLMLLPHLSQEWFEAFPGTLLRQTAMFHTGFNLVVGMLALPFLGQIDRLAKFLVPTPEATSLSVRESFLDPSVLETPSLALARATRETLRMADLVRAMLENFWAAFLERNVELARRIQREDDVVDRINSEVKDYLSQIGGEMNEEDTHWQFTLLTFSNELESVGDLVDKHLCDLLAKQRTEGIFLEQPDFDRASEAYRRVLTRFEAAAGLLTTRSKDDAKNFLAGKDAFNDWCRQAQREHYESLRSTSRSTMESSAFFLDLLNALRSANRHISTIGYALYHPAARSRRSPR